jgi:hypothetical protein
MTIKNLTPHVELTASEKALIRKTLESGQSCSETKGKKMAISETGGFGLLVKIEWQESGRNREKTARISIA